MIASPAVAAVLDAMPAHVALLDERGVIISVNAAWKRFACGNGMAADDFGVGRDYPGLCDAGGDDEAGRAASGIRAVLAGRLTEASVEYPCHSPTDQRWFRMTATPLPVAPLGGRGLGAMVMHVDISERKRGEFAELFAQTCDFIVVVDAHGVIETVNPAFTRATGWVATDAELRAVRVPPSAHADRRSRHVRRQQVRRDGSRFEIDWTVSPVYSGNGRLLSHVCFGRDATHQRQLQESLRENDKLRATALLAGAFAHDFNNLLGSVIGLTELCVMESPVGSRLARNLGRIGQAHARAAALVRQLLDFSRQTPKTTQQMRVSEWLAHAEGLLRAALPAPVVLAVVVADDTSVCIDVVQMEQVLLNLCRNAAHAMRHRGGRIELIADRAEPAEPALPVDPDDATDLADPATAPAGAAAPRHMRLRVIDQGEGVAPDLLNKIFEPFFTTKPVGEGTGLGLAAVHGIVSSHDGVIRVASQLGVGTTFSVFLPLAPSGDAT